jgi:hypothetical protein
MKKKSKFDPKVIKQFFIDHTEKIVIGAVGLLFLYFTYSAVMLQANESYKKEPKNLADAVQAAQRTMTAGPTSKPPVAETPISKYYEEIERFKVPEDPKKRVINVTINPGVIAQRDQRGTPNVIPIEELRAVAGRGALGGKDSNAATVGQRWVVVTGLVPYTKQLAEYKRVFDNTGFQGEHDVPEYLGFLVQRAEVVPGAAGEPNWDTVVTYCNEAYLARQMEKWSGTAPEVVDQQRTFPSLTSMLPPRAIGEWGDEVGHPTEIKVISQEERDQVQGNGTAGQQPGIPPRGQIRGGQMPPPTRERGFIRNRPSTPEGRGAAPGVHGGGDQGDDIFGGGNAGGKEDATVAKQEDVAQTPPYFLLRYFDFDVEPGKQYAYRVIPILKNPNSYPSVQENMLQDPLQHRQPLLGMAPGKTRPDANNKVADMQVGPYWSSSCQTARLPGDKRVIAGPAEPPKSPSPTEVTGEVRVLIWDETTGVNKNAHPEGVYRGSVLNYESIDVIAPPEERPSKEKLETDQILVDVMGGEALTPRDRGQIHGSTAMLFLDDRGNLVMSDEMSQTKEWIAETKVPDRPINGGFVGPRGIQSPERSVPRGGRMVPTPRGGGLSSSPDSSLPDMAPRGNR